MIVLPHQQKSLLVYVHDCAPQYLSQLKQIDSFLNGLGIKKVHWLWVPYYHNKNKSIDSSEFLEWCRNKTSFGNYWLLHGYSHFDFDLEQKSKIWNPYRFIMQRVLTQDEGEFAEVTVDQAKNLLNKGYQDYHQCFKTFPRGFVPPAWLAPSWLGQVLKDNQMYYTENHLYFWNLKKGTKVFSPVITWSTLSNWQRKASLYSSAFLLLALKWNPVLRIAIHPQDLEFPEIKSSIESILKKALSQRCLESIDTLL